MIKWTNLSSVFNSDWGEEGGTVREVERGGRKRRGVTGRGGQGEEKEIQCRLTKRKGVKGRKDEIGKEGKIGNI